MANLIVTFTSASNANRDFDPPLEVGSDADTEEIVIGASSTPGNKTGTSAHYVVSLLAEADCWIAIGATPVAVAGSGRKMLSSDRLQFLVSAGDKVAVIEA